jgi:hypothetical protein
MLGGPTLKSRHWIAYGVLVIAAFWLILTITGISQVVARRIESQLPAWVSVTAVIAIPFLAALCSLRLRIDWRARIFLFLVLLLCVPLLPSTFNRHPLIVSAVIVTFMIEEFAVIPVINRRWLGEPL